MLMRPRKLVDLRDLGLGDLAREDVTDALVARMHGQHGARRALAVELEKRSNTPTESWTRGRPREGDLMERRARD
jgi:hypothetical protein